MATAEAARAAGTRSGAIPRPRTARLAAHLPPLLAFVALAVALFLPALSSPAARIIGGSGDAEQTMWFLRWTPWAVTHASDPLLTDHLNYPSGVNLMWNSFAPLLAVLLWPVTALAGLVVSYNTLIAGEIALSGWCAYIAIHRIVGSRPAALCGGLLYGFSPYLLAHAHGHPKVAFAVLPPLLLIALHEVLVVGRHRAAVGGIFVGALLAAQLLVYEEGVVLAIVAGAVGIAVLALVARSQVASVRAYALRALAWAVGTFAVITAVPLAVQLLGPDRISGTVPGASVYVTDLANLVLPTRFQLVAPPVAVHVTARLSGNEVENGAYLGIPLLLVVAIAAVRWRSRPVVRWASITGAVLVLLSLGPQLHVGGHTSRLPLPWHLLASLPFAGSALPIRLFVYVDLVVALLLALVVQSLLAAGRRPAGIAAAVALLGVVGVSLMPRLPFPSQPVHVPAFFSGDDVDALPAGSVALVAPFAHDGPSDAAMLWQAESGMRFRVPEGYFTGTLANGIRRDGPRPTLTSSTMIAIAAGAHPPAMTPGLRARMMAELRHWRIGSVVVGPMPHADAMRGFVTSLLGAEPRRVGGVLLWLLH